MKTLNPFPVVLALCCALAPEAALAQAGALGTVESSRQRRESEEAAARAVKDGQATEMYEGEVSDIGPQAVLLVPRRKTYLEGSADLQYYWTDNFLYTENNRLDTTVLVGTVQAALAPEAYDLAGGLFTPRLGYRHQWYLFGLETDEPFDEANFNAQTVFLDGRYRFGGSWVLDAGLEATRLLDSDGYEEFYKELVPRWGLGWERDVCPATRLSLGYYGAYHASDLTEFTTGGLLDRIDHGGLAALTIQCCPRTVLQPFYRFTYTRYETGTQEDYLHTAGLGLYYFINQQLSVRFFGTFERRESDNPLAEYRKTDAGGGVNFTLRF
jgi:hypothetical protein